MPANLDNITILYSDVPSLQQMQNLPCLPPFDEHVCGFLSAVGQKLLSTPAAKAYPDIITFAFFCRKANLAKLKENYGTRIANRLGRGVSFHIAPSNVPINFAYTMAAGLLSGCCVIVRASSKSFAQTDIITAAVAQVLCLPEYAAVKNRLAIVTYGRESDATAMLSAMCDVRVIWGGDDTIAQIRSHPIPPRSFDITFADRYSACAIDAKNYLADYDAAKTAQDFYNDTYLYDQNACSTPRLICWIGSNADICAAKARFWQALHSYTAPRYQVEPVVAMDKLMTECRCAIGLEQVMVPPHADNLISRIQLSALTEDVPQYRCAGGSFLEYDCTDLTAFAAIVTRKYQTLSYIGLDAQELKSFCTQQGLCGVDRIVPVGKTADFTLTWDGYDLIETMSRIVYTA
ncbi:MAG: acyl-CoA reductase [Oscillospiraceae bacterium]|nr:acyl-CoA reductase [Oscillospiraceae bacterium]